MPPLISWVVDGASPAGWECVDRLGQRVARELGQVWANWCEHVVGRDYPEVDQLIQLEANLLPQVLDRARELASVAGGAKLIVDLCVDDHHEPILVGDGRARRAAWR